MAKQDRTRKSAPQNKAKSFVTANERIPPSSELDSDELVQFDAIIDSREFDTWLPADVATATHLARTEVERDRTKAEYLAEGKKIEDHNGKQIVNPLFTVYSALDTIANRTRRDLGLSASQRGVAGNRQKKRNEKDAEAKSTLATVSSLIARPGA